MDICNNRNAPSIHTSGKFFVVSEELSSGNPHAVEKAIRKEIFIQENSRM